MEYKYIGSGAAFPGIPARDLSDAEVEALEKQWWEKHKSEPSLQEFKSFNELLKATKLYKEVIKPKSEKEGE